MGHVWKKSSFFRVRNAYVLHRHIDKLRQECLHGRELEPDDLRRAHCRGYSLSWPLRFHIDA